MHNGDEQQAHRVSQEVTLPAFDLLACIRASFSALFSHLDALTVKQASTRLGPPTSGDAQLHAQVIMYRLPSPLAPPPLIGVRNCPVWGQIVRSITSGTPIAIQVEDGIDDLLSLRGNFAASGPLGWNKGFKEVPLSIRHVCGICLSSSHLKKFTIPWSFHF